MPLGSRYSRQEILVEVGKAGQERVQSTCFVPGDSTPLDVRSAANLYAEASGFALQREGRVVQTGCPAPSVAAHFRHAASRALGLGASAALDAFGAALAATTASDPKE